MKHCDKCGVDVRGNSEFCPLCQGTLTGESEPVYSIYPHIETLYSKNRLFFKLTMTASVAAAVVCAAINWMTRGHGWWSLYVLFALACFWIILRLAIRKQNNLPKYITVQIVVLSALACLWDAFTGWRGWSLNYFFPIASTVGVLSLLAISQIMRMRPADYIVYLIVDFLAGAVSFIFYLTGLCDIALPVVICVSCSIISMAAVVIFEGKNILSELEKRFHL
ncbi:MAG: DUF6320 domain-containing protein [Eubacteriales bacterium]